MCVPRTVKEKSPFGLWCVPYRYRARKVIDFKFCSVYRIVERGVVRIFYDVIRTDVFSFLRRRLCELWVSGDPLLRRDAVSPADSVLCTRIRPCSL